MPLVSAVSDFNTSHVSINRHAWRRSGHKNMDFNTSHVSINPTYLGGFVFPIILSIPEKITLFPIFYQVNYTYFFAIKKMQKFLIFTSFSRTFPSFAPGKNS